MALSDDECDVIVRALIREGWAMASHGNGIKAALRTVTLAPGEVDANGLSASKVDEARAIAHDTMKRERGGSPAGERLVAVGYINGMLAALTDYIRNPSATSWAEMVLAMHQYQAAIKGR